jgi:DNA-binding response OmpR family regulator
MRLLLIDDEPHIRRMMRLTLEPAGYEVDEAADGQAGLDAFRNRGDYAAVILDQKMPGLTGLETLQRIREHAPEARVLMLTAFASIELAVDAMRLGASDFLRKPMTPETLRAAVAAAVGSRPPARPVGPHTPPEIVTLTLNGFQIRRSQTSTAPGPASEHEFLVKQFADDSDRTVRVAVDAAAVEQVARLTHRRLEPASGFWRLQAERLLAGYLWTEGVCPPNGRLTLRDVSREDLDVAARWEDG